MCTFWVDAVEFMTGPTAFRRVEFAVIQPQRSVRRIIVEAEFQTGDAGEVRAQRSRRQSTVALQRYLHKVFALTFAHGYVLFRVFHRVFTNRCVSNAMYVAKTGGDYRVDNTWRIDPFSQKNGTYRLQQTNCY